MAEFVSISEARAKLGELVKISEDGDVVLLKHGKPEAVLMSVRRHTAFMEEIEDLEDRLSVHEREHLTMSLDKVLAELGL